jgi:soluble lytic murein transglycosylase-like protein
MQNNYRRGMSCRTRFTLLVFFLLVLALVIVIYFPSFGKELVSVGKGLASHSTLSLSASTPAAASSSSSCSGTGYVKLACQDAQAVGISPDYFVRQINQESGFQPDVVGGSGEIGIAQFMPDTAAGLGLNPHDPIASLKAAAHLMASYQHLFGNYAMALAAYNAGSARVAAAVAKGGASWGAYIPVSTRSYVCNIMGELC